MVFDVMLLVFVGVVERDVDWVMLLLVVIWIVVGLWGVVVPCFVDL